MILYFSGTGNSRHVAKRMAAELDDQLLDLNERIKAEDTSLVETGEDLVAVSRIIMRIWWWSHPPTHGGFPAWCGTGC